MHLVSSHLLEMMAFNASTASDPNYSYDSLRPFALTIFLSSNEIALIWLIIGSDSCPTSTRSVSAPLDFSVCSFGRHQRDTWTVQLRSLLSAGTLTFEYLHASHSLFGS